MVGIVHNYSFGVHSLVTVIQNYFVSGQTELKTNSVAKFDRFVVRYDLPCIYEYIQYSTSMNCAYNSLLSTRTYQPLRTYGVQFYGVLASSYYNVGTPYSSTVE